MNRALNNISAIERFTESNKFPASRISILLAEDNPIVRKSSLKKLKSIGYECDFAVDGQQALQMAQTKSYDLILMDIYMPIMNGIESADKIRQEAQAGQEHQPVVVALTSDTSRQTRDNCFAAGMHEHMQKPLQLNQLMGFITKIWSKKFDQEK